MTVKSNPLSMRTLAIAAACSLFVASCGGDETEAADETTTTEAAGEEAAEETDTPAETAAAGEDTTTTEAELAEEETTTTEEDPAGEDSADGDSSTTEADAPATAPSVTITAVSFSGNTITISNDGDAAIDLDGYYLCNRPSYAPLPATVLEPGATMDLDGSVIDIQGDGGEVGLYSSEQFDSEADLVAYVQWGNGDNGRASVAVAGGLIADGEFVDNGGEDFTNG